MSISKAIHIDRINTWAEKIQSGGVAIMPSSLVEEVTNSIRTHLPGIAFCINNEQSGGSHSYVSMQRTPYIRLDADNEGQFLKVLEKKFSHVMEQLAVQNIVLKELYEDLEDIERLRKLIMQEQVLPQDLETLDLMEQEMDEIYGD